MTAKGEGFGTTPTYRDPTKRPVSVSRYEDREQEKRKLGPLSNERDVEDLRSLVPAKKERSALADVPTKTAIGTKTGTGVATTVAKKTTAGIASPLTEGSFGARTYHAIKQLTSSDGLITFEYTPIHELTMSDTNNATAKFIYAAPP
jgi:hypothetical protein